MQIPHCQPLIQLVPGFEPLLVAGLLTDLNPPCGRLLVSFERLFVVGFEFLVSKQLVLNLSYSMSFESYLTWSSWSHGFEPLFVAGR